MPDARINLKTAADLAAVEKAVTSYTALDKTQQAIARSATTAAANMARLDGALKGPQAQADALRVHLQQAVALDPKQAVSALNQIAAAERKAAKDLGPALPRTLESFGTQAIDQFKVGLISIVGPAAVASAAIAAIPAAIDLAKLGAQADLVRTRFDALAASAGISGDALLVALRKGSGREISDLNLQLAANKAQLLGVAHSAEEFGVLMSIARDRAQQMGITTTQAFDDLVTGLGRGSRLILDNLGILVNADQANQAYARSVGKTVAQLSDQERKQALINQVIKDGNASLLATGGAVETAAAGQARLSASWDNIKASAGSAISQGVAPFINSLSDLINISDGSKEGVASLVNGLIDFSRQIGGLPPLTAAQTKAQQDWTTSVQDWIIAREVQLGLMDAQPVNSGGGGAFEFPDVALARESTEAQLNYANAMALTGIQARAAQQAAEQKSTADKLASIDAQTHAVAEQQLADQAMAAANALIQAGPAGARSAALLAGSSGGVDVLTAAYYRLFAAKQAAIGPTSVDKGEREFSSKDELAGVAATSAAGKTAALRNQILQTGTATQVLTQRQKDYADAVARFGAKSEQAINAQTAVMTAQQQLANTHVSTAKSLTSEADKQLTTEEKIRDAKIDQYKASLDIQKTRAQGVLDSIKEDQEIKTANAILKSSAGDTFKRAAQARLDLVDATRKERDLSISEKQATVSGTITAKGQLLQSVPAAGAAPVGGPALTPTVGSAPAAGPSLTPTAATGGAYTINLVVDGKTLASVSEPYIMDSIMKAVNTAKARAGA